MTASTITAAVRSNLKDEDSGNYRWTDATLWRYLSDGLRDAKKLRADLYLDGSTMTAITEITAGTDVLPLDEGYRKALTAYVCSECLREEGNEAANIQRADTFYGEYLRELLGVSK